ncbi:FHA domain-containing protein [Cellulomonas palmilytica]|uniref:FHA domain-containing protein n=1 Tax=Cellulomonas palmilytica TaxID=2608402 RepID=UPI001F360672|nr:FHA domain-containing protein [Cellulomonas palmilytica]UJP39401.1 FHA domain-containing protein [Cellulomonas palmilytica]
MSVPEYLPGRWTAASRPGFVALLGPTAAPATARAVWEASSDGLLAALVVLARNGFAGLPAFALVHLDGDRAHLALRGDVTAEVGTASGTRTLRSGDVGTWSEQVVEDVTWVRLRGDDASDEGTRLPLADGVAPASALSVVLVEGADLVADEVAAGEADEVADDVVVVAAPDVEPEPATEEPAHELEESGAAEDEPAADLAAGAVSDTASDAESDTASDAESDTASDDVPAPAVIDVPAAPAAPSAPSLPVLPPPGAAILGEPLEEAAEVPAQRSEPDAPQPAEAVTVPAAGEGVADDVADEPAERPAHEADVAGSPVDVTATHVNPVVPDVPARPEPSAPEPVPALVALGTPEADVESTVDDVRTLVGPASQDDHDGLTILSSDLAQIREQLPAWAAQWPQEGATPGPFTVPEPAAPQDPPRLVLSTGVEVTLDRTVLLGRAPQVARVTNRELPRLVAVPSPQQDISRTHAEVRAEGEHVLVTDLHSTNGVHVTRQGEGARRLHPGEASVVVPGEVVDLGDGVTFTVEAGR